MNLGIKAKVFVGRGSGATIAAGNSKESLLIHLVSGIDNLRSKSLGSKCLMARRLVESGVRLVPVYRDGEWDAHNNLQEIHRHHCAASDVPLASLLTDLEARGRLAFRDLGW